ncbi:heavy metal translocating P-type ATPase [Rhodothalassium salexigens]|uniref:heavy metal translocating P-type ATPase n=1 Tax=Rhodothalassium salexigens TaxID=1086 RepID=UPI001912FC4B|nr:heavy metal translocating P-type ATPase [Rhodothalassium salexigens]MBK5911998.1 heavy metal translocating P-type ATPase [Rhodothalassium salexigens]
MTPTARDEDNTQGNAPDGVPVTLGRADPAAALERALGLERYVRRDGDSASISLVVPGMHCAGCMAKVERALNGDEAVTRARANLSTKRVSVSWTSGRTTPEALIARLDAIGFDAAPFDPKLVGSDQHTREGELLRAMGVAGFAAANVMLLSVSVWAGLWSDDMAPATRQLFHWISALIAIPAVAYAGRPFFRSALGALRRRTMNMDVPISLAVVLALAASMIEAARGGEHVYFDASVSLLFFLLIGRYLDVRMRGRATEAAQNLLGLKAVAATVVRPDGSRAQVPVDALDPGMRVLVPAGMRVPADGVVRAGASSIDAGLITGEAVPEDVAEGCRVFAGTLNLSAPITVTVTKRDEDSLLAEIVRLMEAAEQGRADFVQLADKLVRFYAPAVHILAAGTFGGWMLAGATWHDALLKAVAVLIITCPCALGLAVPVVQVAATGRLMRRGVLVKTGDALERLSRADTVVFDKTGTLTAGDLTLVAGQDHDPADRALAAALAQNSRHPLSQAIVRAARDAGGRLPQADAVGEVPGCGLTGRVDGRTVRLGNAAWLGHGGEAGTARAEAAGPEMWLDRGDGGPPVRFAFLDHPRADAAETVAALKRLGMRVELLSGDRAPAVRAAAEAAGIDHWHGAKSPADKIAHLKALADQGRTVAMVGDGLNDAPALATAHVSVSPASAADVSQTAADVVFQGDRLGPVAGLFILARRSQRRIVENFGLALTYNAIAVPLAVAGFVTPLVAAIAMSSSSILVTANALRLRLKEAP